MNTRVCPPTAAIDLIATLIARGVQLGVVPMGDEVQVSWPSVVAQPAIVPTEYPMPPNGPRAA